MFKVGLTSLLQHLIAQNEWAKFLLIPFAGKSIQFNVSILEQSLVVLEDGQLAMAGVTNDPDTIITLSPTTLLRLITDDEAAKMDITMTGDTALAKVMAQVFSNLHWDAEDDLSRIIGDVPAQKLSAASHQLMFSIKESSTNAIQMITEYLQEEKQFIAKKRHVDMFNAEVDELRASTARLEKKIAKLAKRLQQNTSYSENS